MVQCIRVILRSSIRVLMCAFACMCVRLYRCECVRWSVHCTCVLVLVVSSTCLCYSVSHTIAYKFCCSFLFRLLFHSQFGTSMSASAWMDAELKERNKTNKTQHQTPAAAAAAHEWCGKTYRNPIAERKTHESTGVLYIHDERVLYRVYTSMWMECDYVRFRLDSLLLCMTVSRIWTHSVQKHFVSWLVCLLASSLACSLAFLLQTQNCCKTKEISPEKDEPHQKKAKTKKKK